MVMVNKPSSGIRSIGVESIGILLLDFIHQTFPIARAKKVGLTDQLFDLGVLDSMGILDVLVFVQKEFGIVVDTSDLVLDNFGTIASMARFVSEHLPS